MSKLKEAVDRTSCNSVGSQFHAQSAATENAPSRRILLLPIHLVLGALPSVPQEWVFVGTDGQWHVVPQGEFKSAIYIYSLSTTFFFSIFV